MTNPDTIAVIVGECPVRKPDDGNGDDDAYNAGWNACRAYFADRLAALGDDTKRLNFLAHHGAALRCDDQMEGGGWFVRAPYHTEISSVDGRERFPTLRAAIDAGLRQENEDD